MNMVTVKLSERNQMVLPKEAREALGVKPGGRVMVVIERQSVRLLPEPENWTEYIYGLGAEVWAALGGGERFLQEERAGWGSSWSGETRPGDDPSAAPAPDSLRTAPFTD